MSTLRKLLDVDVEAHTINHGTVKAYNGQDGCRRCDTCLAKCRCAACKKAMSDYNRKRRAERIAQGLAPDDPRHGTPTGYMGWGCKCDPCAKAAMESVVLNRDRAQERGLAPGDPRHGTDTGYVYHGCRCDLCRDRREERSSEYRAKRYAKGLAPDDPRHGTDIGYASWGCRCDPCTAAHTEYQRDRRSLKPIDLPEGMEHRSAEAVAAGCRCGLCRIHLIETREPEGQL